MTTIRTRDVNLALPRLARYVMDSGEEVGSRNGRCMEVLHTTVHLTDPRRRYVRLPERRASLPAQIAETMWILAGRNDIRWLSHYLPRAADFSDDGVGWRGGYGPRIRNWWREEGEVDQLEHVVRLLRDDPMTRRAVINIYDPAVDTAPGKDVPCNNWLHFVNRNGALDLAVTIRSNDLIWGWSGINAFEWSALLEIVAKLVGVNVGELVFHISSLHVYEKHWPRARKIAHAVPLPVPTTLAAPFGLPSTAGVGALDALISRWFNLEERIRSNAVTDQMDIDTFPEPMMRQWLRVLQWWWGPYNVDHLRDFNLPDELVEALTHSPGKPGQPPQPAPVEIAAVEDTALCSPQVVMVETDVQRNTKAFQDYVIGLHTAKDAAYGDSWRRRGEMLGIMANIARKVDRLGQSDDHETAADTAIDLWVYLLKYQIWLAENVTSDALRAMALQLDPEPTHAGKVAVLIRSAHPSVCSPNEYEGIYSSLRQDFDQLELEVKGELPGRWEFVAAMAGTAAMLARSQWVTQQWHAANATRSWNPEAGQ